MGLYLFLCRFHFIDRSNFRYWLGSSPVTYINIFTGSTCSMHLPLGFITNLSSSIKEIIYYCLGKDYITTKLWRRTESHFKIKLYRILYKAQNNQFLLSVGASPVFCLRLMYIYTHYILLLLIGVCVVAMRIFGSTSPSWFPWRLQIF